MKFETACIPHRGALLATAMIVCRNRADAEDLVQDTLVRAMEKWHTYRPGQEVRPWLYRILSNIFIDGYRQQRRRKAQQQAFSEEIVERTGGHPAAPREGLSDEVAVALKQLEPSCMEVVDLVDLQGKDYEAAAASLKLPDGTVMSRLYRARRALEPVLSDYAAAEYGIRRS